MTCIVGIEHEGKVYIGGDSAASSDWTQTSCADDKVFQKGSFLLGYTSSFRMGQLLKYSLTPPLNLEEKPDMDFLVNNFISEVRKLFRENNFAQKDREVETGGQFLVGYRGNLYTVQDDYSVLRYSQKYSSVGSGSNVALGALYATIGMPPKQRIEIALNAASEHNPYVRSPYTVLEL